MAAARAAVVAPDIGQPFTAAQAQERGIWPSARHAEREPPVGVARACGRDALLRVAAVAGGGGPMTGA